MVDSDTGEKRATSREGKGRRYRARYRDLEGRQHSKSFHRKVDADRWLREQLRKLDAGKWIDPGAGKLAFSEWAEAWLASKTDIKPKTRKSYRTQLDARIYPRFERTPLAAINRDAVQAWVSDLGGRLSASSVRQAHQCLAAILEDAVAEGIIGRNPARRVRLPRIEEPPRRFLTADEVDRLADAMPDLMHRSMVYVLAYGGVRFGELAALRRRRVDLDARKLRVEESVAEAKGGHTIGGTKTHQSRTVSLPGFVADVLAEWLAEVPDDPEAFVFPSSSGGPLWYATVRKVWDPARERAGLEDVTPHDLRHTCASLMRSVGADVKAIQQQLGHRSPVVTMTVYTHLFEGELDDVMARLERGR